MFDLVLKVREALKIKVRVSGGDREWWYGTGCGDVVFFGVRVVLEAVDQVRGVSKGRKGPAWVEVFSHFERGTDGKCQGFGSLGHFGQGQKYLYRQSTREGYFWR